MQNLRETHKCTLAYKSKSGLPKLPPNASKWKKLLRSMKKLSLISPYNRKTKFIFRSNVSIFMEKQRQIRYFSKYVVHPFSIIAMIREFIMFVVWFLNFIMSIYWLAFGEKVGLLATFIQSLDLFIAVHIILCFFVGFYDSRNKEVVLDLKEIATRYVKTYFLVDVLALLPFEMFDVKDSFHLIVIVVTDLMLCIRIVTMCSYFRQVTLALDLGDIVHELLCLILGGLLLAHWFACVLYIVPSIPNKFSGNKTSVSWINVAGIGGNSNTTMISRYVKCLHKATAHFIGCGLGMWYTKDAFEAIVFSVIILTGMFYFGYVTALVLELSRSYKMSDSLYDKLMCQLTLFMRNRKLPLRVSCRLRLYYANRFKMRFFRETVILETLSEHLRFEIMLHNCRPFLESAWFFRHLNKHLIGQLVANLESIVVLTHDVIVTNADVSEKIYFISRGTVAIMRSNGQELGHTVDGDHFGEMYLLSKMADFKISEYCQSVSYVAVEICELYVLKKDDFLKYVATDNSALSKLIEVAKLRNEGTKMRCLALDREGDAKLSMTLENTDFVERGTLRNFQDVSQLCGHLSYRDQLD